jgi:hypothetical protein
MGCSANDTQSAAHPRTVGLGTHAGSARLCRPRSCSWAQRAPAAQRLCKHAERRTSSSANSKAVPGPREVVRLPSTTTRSVTRLRDRRASGAARVVAGTGRGRAAVVRLVPCVGWPLRGAHGRCLARGGWQGGSPLGNVAAPAVLRPCSRRRRCSRARECCGCGRVPLVRQLVGEGGVRRRGPPAQQALRLEKAASGAASTGGRRTSRRAAAPAAFSPSPGPFA